MKEFLVVLMILAFIGAGQIYIMIGQRESWGWIGFGLLIALLLGAFFVDSRGDR